MGVVGKNGTAPTKAGLQPGNINWTDNEKAEIIAEAKKLIAGSETANFTSILKQAQKVLPASRQRRIATAYNSSFNWFTGELRSNPTRSPSSPPTPLGRSHPQAIRAKDIAPVEPAPLKGTASLARPLASPIEAGSHGFIPPRIPEPDLIEGGSVVMPEEATAIVAASAAKEEESPEPEHQKARIMAPLGRPIEIEDLLQVNPLLLLAALDIQYTARVEQMSEVFVGMEAMFDKMGEVKRITNGRRIKEAIRRQLDRRLAPEG